MIKSGKSDTLLFFTFTIFPTVNGLLESKSTAISVHHPLPIRIIGPPDKFREPRFESAV